MLMVRKVVQYHTLMYTRSPVETQK